MPATGMIVALWGREQLAENSGVETAAAGPGSCWRRCRSPAEVDALIEEAQGAGPRIARQGAETSWGGYSGAFVDPDGHPWEVAHNPHSILAADGSLVLPP